MDLHLDLETAPGRSLRARAEHALREAVRSGRLPPGTRLPATRALAVELGVSRGVVVDAYAQLAAEGYLRTRRGGGTTVAEAATPAPARAGVPRAAPWAGGSRFRYDLRPSLPAVDGFPRTAWLAALGRVLRTVEDRRLGYGDPAGEPELRTAIAQRLARARGVRADPADIVITGGLRHGLPVAWSLLARRGVRRVGVEQPGWRRIPESLRAAGLEPVPVPVDDEGLDPRALAVHRVDALAVTPAHHFPTGAVLGPERRATLVAWAREHDAFVLEDDYDAEFRYDRQPVGSLQGLAPERVLHGGSFSKTLAPALRIGWLVLPPALAAERDPDDEPLGGSPPPLDQLALADLMGRGEIDRHLRRQRNRYRRRRDALLAALADELPEVEVRGAAAGLFAVLLLPAGADEAAALEAATRAGFALEGAGVGAAGGPAGLAVGYANLPEPAAPTAARALAAAIRASFGR